MAYQYKRAPITAEEEDRLVNVCQDHREKLIIWTFLDTGLRVSELTSLKPENIQWQERRLMIYGKGGFYGKKTKRRIVPLTDRVRKLFEIQFSLKNNMGLSVRTAQRVLRKVADRARITRTVSPHVLRHRFAVKAIQKGISTRALQEFLGHDHLTTTEIYLNLSPEQALAEFHSKWQ